MSCITKKIKLIILVCIAVLITAFAWYKIFIWIDTSSVMQQLNQITKESPNSREMFKDDFWILVPEADEDGRITRHVTRITRNNLWVWGNEGTMRVNIFFDDRYSNGAPYSYEANWNVSIEKINGKWEIVDYKNIP